MEEEEGWMLKEVVRLVGEGVVEKVRKKESEELEYLQGVGELCLISD